LEQVRHKFGTDEGRIGRLSLIDENDGKFVRMAHLACVGSHKINGVAALHSELLQKTTLLDFYEFFPEKFTNVTNGVTPRRWIVLSNPKLTNLITSCIGDNWIKHLEDVQRIETYAEDPGFQQEWQQIKRENKVNVAEILLDRTGVKVDPDSLFDIQVKRIHQYKRQHLNILHAITLYNQIKQNPGIDVTPRTLIFAGKAAPGYYIAKLIIKLINSVAEVVNKDPDIGDRLKVVFLPDYNVKNSQPIYPAADLSEQISTAGKEASGTGNMKFAMNGALTIGTLDGANIEIRNAVGAENFFLFGLTTEDVGALRLTGYRPWEYYKENPQLKQAIDQIASGYFSHGDRSLFKPLVDLLLDKDPFMLMADYQPYIDCQQQVSQTYRDRDRWLQMSILNTARMGKFSSDRAIREYCQQIWKVQPVPVQLAAEKTGDGWFGTVTSDQLSVTSDQ
ncbi:glycogen/starch/alpha-glucan family phosphorylase, partial [Chroococcidiopsidales cyanobacterium LEGE 13417]|nr:glycogen/starch/alpha-glucan family phosphorylase [Chroococcidiopsidales cyanobacterium LEGE 13417]